MNKDYTPGPRFPVEYKGYLDQCRDAVAYAKLSAAALELLEALEEVMMYMDPTEYPTVCAKANAAIAKAKGVE